MTRLYIVFQPSPHFSFAIFFKFFFPLLFAFLCSFLCLFFFSSHTIIINAHFKSRHTNSNSTGKEEGSSSTGDGFEVPSSYYSINIFQVTKAERKKKDPKIERKRNKSWYEELHQATLPAH